MMMGIYVARFTLEYHLFASISIEYIINVKA